mgnify:CR=1 FL=1|jgi:Branched-chain amino acid transport system / permease component.
MIEILLFSIITGLIYILMAAGFNMILGVAKIVDLAYGAQMLVTAYIAASLLSITPLPIALAGAVAASIVWGLLYGLSCGSLGEI